MKTNALRRPSYALVLIFSLLLHGIVLLVSIKDSTPSLAKRVSFQEERINIHLLSRPTSEVKQIVQTEDSGEKKRPEEARYLGERDQTFTKEMVARETGVFQKAGKGDEQASEQTSESHQHQQVGTVDWSTLSSAIRDEVLNSSEQIKASREMKKQLQEISAKYQDTSSARGIATGDISLTGMAKTNDFIEDIPLGDMNHLNTIEFKYYGFYHRIRQQLEQYWGATLQQKAREIYARGSRVPAGENVITSLEIVLDDMGKIVEIRVITSSGVRQFDDAAIESFAKAGPFPNPPQGLLQNGRAVINWGFVVRS